METAKEVTTFLSTTKGVDGVEFATTWALRKLNASRMLVVMGIADTG